MILLCTNCQMIFSDDEAVIKEYPRDMENLHCPRCDSWHIIRALQCSMCGTYIADYKAKYMGNIICDSCTDQLMEQNEFYEICKGCHRLVDSAMIEDNYCWICKLDNATEQLFRAIKEAKHA